MGRLSDNGSLKQQIGSFAKTCQGVLIVGDASKVHTIRAALLDDGVSTSYKDPGSMQGGNVDVRGSRLILLVGIDHRQAWSLIASIRNQALKPIIALFGAGSETDRIVSLELGADEASPVLSNLETMAKIRSILRRNELYALSEPTLLVFRGFQLDVDRRSLLSPERRMVPLTGREFDVLKVFASRPNRIFSREQVLDLVGSGESCMERAVDSCITRLRKKLRKAGARDEVIQTVRGAGYQLVK